MRTFDGIEINGLFATHQQDIFALCMLGTENKGVFVDIGCKYPIHHNNSFLLERYGWKGIGVDMDDWSQLWQQSRPESIFICNNALKLDYKNIFNQKINGNVIDYLSIDTDGLGVSYSCLQMIIDTNYEFKVMTIEHDAYTGEHYEIAHMIPQRELLKSKGYILVREDAYIEDFWVNPKYVSSDIYEKFMYVNKKGEHNRHFWEYCYNIGFDFTKLYR